MEAIQGNALMIIGLMLLAGYLAHVTGPRIQIPRVTILLILGALAGPSALGLVPDNVPEWFPFVSHMALAMIGFLLGESFAGKDIKEKGKTVLAVTVGETLMAAGLVFLAVYLLSGSLALGLIMAGIAPASAPAAIFETVKEGGAKGPLTSTVLGVVAIDDGWGVILFSVFLVLAQSVGGEGAHLAELAKGGWEVVGAVLLGGALGFPMVWITDRVRKGQPTLIEAMGFVFLCAGAASALQVSYLLACMVMGAMVANLAHECTRPFHAIEKVREPFLAIFFLLAGIELDVTQLTAIGLLGAVYIAARAAGLVSGGYIAGHLTDAPEQVKKRVGFCILPQAGVALGFALLVKERMPELGETVLTLVIATTVVFEIFGPLAAKSQLKRAGEMREAPEGDQPKS